MPLYGFHCRWCGTTTDKIFKASETRPESIPCPECKDYPAEYQIGAPSHYKIGYEQNGRKAFKVDMGTGKKVYRSATRENFEHKAGNVAAKKYHEMGHVEKRSLNDSVLTKGFKEHMKKVGK